MNDDPANYAVMTPGEWIQHLRRLRPALFDASELKRRAATAEHNRLRGRVERAARYLPHYWYAIDVARRTVLNVPFKSRYLLLLAHGIASPTNGRVKRTPFPIMRGAALNEPPYNGFAREGDSPCVKNADQLSTLLAANALPLLDNTRQAS